MKCSYKKIKQKIQGRCFVICLYNSFFNCSSYGQENFITIETIHSLYSNISAIPKPFLKLLPERFQTSS